MQKHCRKSFSILGGIAVGSSICVIVDAILMNIINKLNPTVNILFFAPYIIITALGILLACIPPENLKDDEDNQSVVDRSRMILGLTLSGMVFCICIMSILAMLTRNRILTAMDEQSDPSPNHVVRLINWLWSRRNNQNGSGTVVNWDLWTPIAFLVATILNSFGFFMLFFGRQI